MVSKRNWKRSIEKWESIVNGSSSWYGECGFCSEYGPDWITETNRRCKRCELYKAKACANDRTPTTANYTYWKWQRAVLPELKEIYAKKMLAAIRKAKPKDEN
jgi:hypothetical protein